MCLHVYMYKVRHVASGGGDGGGGVIIHIEKFNYHVVAIPSFWVDVRNRHVNKEIKREIEV